MEGPQQNSGLVSDDSDIVLQLQNSMVARNKNFDPSLRGNQLRLDLKSRWMRCSTNVAARPDISVTWFDKLCQYHTEPQRHYHTLAHLEEMLLYFELVQTFRSYNETLTKQEEDSIILATFFHDAIYDVHSATNEEDSAKLFQQYMHQVRKTDQDFQELETFVAECILATKSHKVDIEVPNCLALFLDLDMAVLGKERRAYLNYSSLIRKEYDYVPHDVFCKKRADILENFLEQQRIFGTQIMHGAFEKRARDNVATEIEILRQGQIPGEECEEMEDDFEDEPSKNSSTSLLAPPTYYEILQVPRSATFEEVKAAYQVNLRQIHPDKQLLSGSSKTGDVFLSLQKAWECLRDPQSRRDYDQELHRRQKGDRSKSIPLASGEWELVEDGETGDLGYTTVCRCGEDIWLSRHQYEQEQKATSPERQLIHCDGCSLIYHIEKSE